MASDRPSRARQDVTGVHVEPDSRPAGIPAEEDPDLVARIAARIVSSRDVPAGLLLIDEIERSLAARAWLVCRCPETEEICWARLPDSEPFPLRLGTEEGGLVHATLHSGRETIVPDPAACPECPEKRYLRKIGGAWAFLPLMAAGRSVGCLVLRAGSAAALEPGRLAPLKVALVTVALAQEVVRLHRELERRVEERTGEITLLYDVSRSLGFVLSPEDLDHLVAGSLGRALTFDYCAFTVLIPDHRRISVHLSHPVGGRVLHVLRREVIAEVARVAGARPRRLPMSVSGPERDGGRVPGAQRIASVAHAPLVIRGQIVGLISVGSREKEAFGHAQLRLVYTIASQASLTLDRIRTAREAEASRIHSMLESMAEGVMLLDRDLKVVMTNPAAQSHLEFLEGRVPETLARLGDVALRPLLEMLGGAAGRSRTFEVAAASEGKIFSITCSPVRGLDDPAQGLVVVISDVTEARMLQLQFAQNEKLSALGEMISGVAHELNNPLGTVMGFAQILQNEPVDIGVRRKLVAINTEATRCQRIVQNLLRFARRHTPERSAMDLHAAIDSVLQLLGHQLQVVDIDVVLDLEERLRPVVGDFHLLQQVFLNIIYNAYQAMKDMGKPGRLTIRTRTLGDRNVVEIIDDGPGIAPQNLKRIFDPFFSTKEVGQGTGLGLSLAYGTVREHGGTITAKSTVGAGTTFVVELPVAPEGTLVAPDPSIPEAAPPPEPSVDRASAGAERPSETTGRRILVVEDEASLAEVMAEVLQTLGHMVDTAGDGRSARDLILARTYDLIISDLKMPNMNGRELYRHVASINPELARRIIFSSGDTASPDSQAFFEEVGNPFLAKPFNLKELIRVVDSVLGAC